MKIMLELETQDLHRMITEYFNKSGFEVKNIDDLCAMFERAFPEGLKVDASILPLPEAPPPAPVESPTYESSVVAGPNYDDDARLPSGDDDNPRLAVHDILDPTKRRPGRVEVQVDDTADIQSVLRRSRSLEQENRGPRNV